MHRTQTSCTLFLALVLSACQKPPAPIDRSHELTVLTAVAAEINGVDPEKIKPNVPLGSQDPPFSGDDLVELLYVSEEKLGILFPITELEKLTGTSDNTEIAKKLTLVQLEKYAIQLREKKREKLSVNP